MQEEFDVTYDSSAYGERGPIELSYPPFQWKGVSTWTKWLFKYICKY